MIGLIKASISINKFIFARTIGPEDFARSKCLFPMAVDRSNRVIFRAVYDDPVVARSGFLARLLERIRGSSHAVAINFTVAHPSLCTSMSGKSNLSHPQAIGAATHKPIAKLTVEHFAGRHAGRYL